jgi:hypothetical protein
MVKLGWYFTCVVVPIISSSSIETYILIEGNCKFDKSYYGNDINLVLVPRKSDRCSQHKASNDIKELAETFL